MTEENKLKFLIHMRWYSAANYLIALGEQIALYYYGFMTFFWIALVLNVITVVGLAIKINNLEKSLASNE